MASSSARLSTPEGPGCVRRAEPPCTGHWVAEDASEEMLAALTEFPASYRDGSAVSAVSAP